MYEILVYLFENCQQREVAYDRERIAKKLSAAGFEHAVPLMAETAAQRLAA